MQTGVEHRLTKWYSTVQNDVLDAFIITIRNVVLLIYVFQEAVFVRYQIVEFPIFLYDYNFQKFDNSIRKFKNKNQYLWHCFQAIILFVHLTW